MEKVPFARLRAAGFYAILAMSGAVSVINHFARTPLADDLTDLGLCIIACSALLCRLLFYFAQREEDERLRCAEQAICRNSDRISGFDKAIAIGEWFKDDETPTLRVAGEDWRPEDAREATGGSMRAADVLAFRPQGSPR